MVVQEDSVASYFTYHLVERSRRDPDLQRYQGGKEEYLGEARCCPKCETSPEQLRWVYVRDDPQPADPAQPVPSREGYLLICDACMLQVDFFCERKW